jgi:hypothetical protein
MLVDSAKHRLIGVSSVNINRIGRQRVRRIGAAALILPRHFCIEVS